MTITLNIKILSCGTTEKIITVENGITYEELLKILNINPETVIILKEKQAVPFDETVTESDLTIIRIVSGG